MKIKLIKNFPTCLKDFQWRKKWAKDWENVIYCSERCRRRKKQNQYRLSIMIKNLERMDINKKLAFRQKAADFLSQLR